MCIDRKQRGLSLVELIMFIAIVSIALTGIVLMTNQTSGRSADTLLRKQALAVAASLLEEVEAQPISGVTACPATPVVSSVRTFPYKVCDYNNFATSGVFDLGGAAVSGLSDYGVVVTVAQQALDNIGAASAVQINVTVTPPVGAAVVLNGYRVDY